MRLIDTVELAQLLSMSTRQLRAHVAAGTVPQPTRVGEKLRWREDDIRRWYDAL